MYENITWTCHVFTTVTVTVKLICYLESTFFTAIHVKFNLFNTCSEKKKRITKIFNT